LQTALINQNSIHKKIEEQTEFRKCLLSFNAEYLVFRSAMKNIKIKIERTENFRVVLYGYEAWFLTLRERHRLRVFENRMLRKMFGSKGDEVTMKWKRIDNEELNFLYCSPNIVRLIK
jgi:hypothetical protein